MANLDQWPFCEESDYIEIGEPFSVDKCRSNEEYYARLKERSFKEPNVYAALETNEEPNMNTEPKPQNRARVGLLSQILKTAVHKSINFGTYCKLDVKKLDENNKENNIN